MVGLAATIATAIATAISTVVALWWRKVDQTGPVWIHLNGHSWWRAETDPNGAGGDAPTATFRLANAGDGSGFDVTVTGVGCTVHVRDASAGAVHESRNRVPVFTPGEQYHVTAWAEISDWERAVVAVRWEERRQWRTGRAPHLQMIPLVEVAAAPVLTSESWDPVSGYKAVHPEPPGTPLLPDSLRPRWPLPVAGRSGMRSVRRDLLRGRSPRRAGDTGHEGP